MQQNNSRQSNQSEIDFNFIEIVRILLNSKRLIILTTIAVGASGWMYSLYFNPASPPNYESSTVMELGSYPASDEMLSKSRDGRFLIASMDATTSKLKALFEMHRTSGSRHGYFTYITEYDEFINRISIYEIDSQFLKIEVVGATLDIVKNKTNEIINYLKVSHEGLLDNAISKKKREIKNIEEKLLTIDKFINYISEQNDIYISDVAELKLKEIEYKHKLAELNIDLKNKQNFKNTDLAAEIQFKTNHPTSNLTKIVFASFLIGFILVSLVVLIRHALANNYKE